MVFLSRLLSLLDVFVRGAGSTSPREQRGLERVRGRMLDLLARHGGPQRSQLAERVRYAGEMQSLWYLRHDVVKALSAEHGEAAAREHIRPINALFKGYVPKSMMAARTRRRWPR